MLNRRRSGKGRSGESVGLVANSAALLASRLAIAALGWSGTVLIARALPLDEFGQFTLVFTLLGLMSVVTDMGVGRVAIGGVLDESRDQGGFVGSYIVLRAVLGGLGYLLALAVVVVLGYPTAVVAATAVAGIVVLLATPSHALDVVFQAHLSMHVVAVVLVGGMLAQLALTVLIAVVDGSLLAFCVPAVVCELVVLAWKLPLARARVRPRFHVDLRLWGALLREAAPLAVGFGLATIYYRVDALMLSKLDSFESVGIYGVAYKFIDVVHFVSTAVTVPLLTLLVRSWSGDMPAFRLEVRRAASLLALLGGLALAELLAFAGPVTALLYGDQYAVGADATRLLAVSECLSFFVSLSLTCLIAAGSHGRYPLVMLGGLVVNVGLNLVAIPRWSYLGAAGATLVTELVVLGVMWALLLRVDGVRPMRLGHLAVVPLAVGAAVGAGLGSALVVPWPVAAVLTALVFGTVAASGGLLRAAGVRLPRRAAAT